MCYYGNKLYQSGDVFAVDDGCNVCVCGNGLVRCTEIACPTIGKLNLLLLSDQNNLNL